MTFSIVAFDRSATEWGVAVQSKFPAIGAITPWAEAGTGAIATQSWIEVSYGREGLRLLRDGISAVDALRRLVADDAGRDRRQVGIVDREGRVATFTGRACADWAGTRTGDAYAALGNLLVSAATLDALAETFASTADRPLAERLVVSLAAAQAAGGDRRGQQSAALRVVREGGGYGACGIVVDLRVDDHAQPCDELARLYRVHELHFGETPTAQWIPATGELLQRIRLRLAQLGYDGRDLPRALEDWAGYANLEARLRGVDAFDPVLLGQLLE